jgi:hypothetical protein
MDAPFDHGYALLIAVNESQMPNYALPTVAKDAAALHAVLVHPERCAYLPENVRVIQGAEASREGIRAGLAWLRDRLSQDTSGNATAVVYYTGHGARDTSDNTFYLIPYDFGIPVRTTAIPAQQFATELESVRPRRLLVILDCCHAAGMNIKGHDPATAEGWRHAAAAPESAALSELGQGQGRAVLSSSTGEEQSYIRPDMSMSIFTYHLIESLTGFAGNANGATEVLVSDVMGFVSRTVPASVRTAYGLSQTPVFFVSGENFPVAQLLGGKGIAKGQRPPSPLSVEYWPPQDISTSGGAYVGGDVRTRGDFIGRDQIRGDAVTGSKYILSGDFRGAIVNIESQMARVTQTITAAPLADGRDQVLLLQLVADLRAELEQVPSAHAPAVQNVAARLQGLVTELDRGDREMIGLMGDSLGRAAAELETVRPAVPTAAAQLAETLRRFIR